MLLKFSFSNVITIISLIERRRISNVIPKFGKYFVVYNFYFVAFSKI